MGLAIVIAGALLGYMTRTRDIIETTSFCTASQQRDCLRSVDVQIVDVQAAANVHRGYYDFEPRDQAMNLTVRFPDGSSQRVFVPDGEEEARVASTAAVTILNGTIVAVQIPNAELEFTNKADNPLITNISIVIAAFGSLIFIHIVWQARTYRDIRSKGGTPAGIPSLGVTLGASLLATATGMLTAMLWAAYLPRDPGFVWFLVPVIATIVPTVLFDRYFTRKITGLDKGSAGRKV